jgi:hypothetical protein
MIDAINEGSMANLGAVTQSATVDLQDRYRAVRPVTWSARYVACRPSLGKLLGSNWALSMSNQIRSPSGEEIQAPPGL